MRKKDTRIRGPRAFSKVQVTMPWLVRQGTLFLRGDYFLLHNSIRLSPSRHWNLSCLPRLPVLLLGHWIRDGGKRERDL